MRRVARLLPGLLLLAACARIAAPPGLAPDKTPPRLEVRSPASGSRGMPGDLSIWLEFDEYMDRGSVRAALSLNPRPEGELQLDWFGRHLRVRPGQDLPAGRTWTLEVGTGARDLAGNPLAAPVRLPFATGDALDSLELVFQLEDLLGDGLAQLWLWPQGQEPRRAFGRAPWRASPDEQGRARLVGLPAGRWWALAVHDANRDGWWNPLEEAAGLPSRFVATPDSQAAVAPRLRLTRQLWVDSLSLEGGQFVDRRTVEFRGRLEPPGLEDWPAAERQGARADSLRLAGLRLRTVQGKPLSLAGLAPGGAGWRLYLAEPADSVEHQLELLDGSDSLRLRAIGGADGAPRLVDAAKLGQGWKEGVLELACGFAVDAQPEKVRQAGEADTLAVAIRRAAADRWELRPPREGGNLLFDKGFLRGGGALWPDTLVVLPVPALADRSAATGGIQFTWDRSPREVGWRLVLQGAGFRREVSAGLEQTLDDLPLGTLTFAMYRDADGDGAWSAGQLRGSPAESWISLPDTVDVLPGWIQGGVVLKLPEWIP